MKKTYVLALALVLAAGAVMAEEPWVQRKAKDGIVVQTRKVAGSGIKEFKGTITMKGVRLSSLLGILDDTPSYVRWQHNCGEASLLKKIDLYKRYSYILTKAPWPVSDRDSIIYSVITQDPKSLAITIRMTGVPNYIPAKKGRVRMPKTNGSWTFIPHGKESVTVVYQLHSESGGKLPDGLANSAVVDIPFHTLQKMSNVVREAKYRDAVYKEVTEP